MMARFLLSVAVTILIILFLILAVTAISNACPSDINPDPNGLVNICNIQAPTV